ncbi:site-specific integrase [Endozoicomonas sp. GU-1]|uniref:site-specific integrase n=1 Tax=Endozoicomonas sp. GU-1 TaxID=3009078 RepID=UPI0022B2B695|nr:site-specific integrase [Endozoicomonas sp. GU-1]WBA87407.1 site-specific integrase [Endozoicomonas sp. GU-1]
MIRKYKKNDGKFRYTATARITINGEPYQDTETFNSEKLASKWIEKRKKEFIALAKQGKTQSESGHKEPDKLLVPELIDLYIKKWHDEPKLDIGGSKLSALECIKHHPLLSRLRATRLNKDVIIKYAEERNKQAKPQTVAQDISYLRQPFKHAREHLNIDIDDIEFKKASPSLKARKLIDNSIPRSRKATPKELGDVIEYLKSSPRRKIPAHDVAEFAYRSCMRLNEICSLKWSDIDDHFRTIFIKQRKDPSNKHRNDQTIPFSPKALEIIKRQKRTDARVFPFKKDSVRAAWARACEKLDIDDLHFHDLRRTGLSQLVESGLSFEEAMVISGHKDYEQLKRYINLDAQKIAKRLEEITRD